MVVEQQELTGLTRKFVTLRKFDEKLNENLTLLNRNTPQTGLSLQLLTLEI